MYRRDILYLVRLFVVVGIRGLFHQRGITESPPSCRFKLLLLMSSADNFHDEGTGPTSST